MVKYQYFFDQVSHVVENYVFYAISEGKKGSSQPLIHSEEHEWNKGRL